MEHASRPGSDARAFIWAAAGALLVLGACDQKEERPATASAASTASTAPTAASVASTASAEWREFEGSWNAAGTRRGIPLGTGRKGSIIDLRGTLLLTGDGRPGVGFRADVIGLVDSETGLVGRAVWTDERGEQVYSELTGEGTKENNHIAGTFLGGTGRYAGVTGTYEFSWQFVIESEDGSIQGRAAGLKGRFRLGATGGGGVTR